MWISKTKLNEKIFAAEKAVQVRMQQAYAEQIQTTRIFKLEQRVTELEAKFGLKTRKSCNCNEANRG